MNISVVIATYNRIQSLDKLVSSLLECKISPSEITIVDSSKDENLSIQKYEKIKYVRSSHPNQPYQRYLGYKISNSDVIVFLDDDMELLNENWLEGVSRVFNDNSVVGMAINFKNDNDFLQKKLPKSKLTNSNKPQNKLKQLSKTFTGYKQQKPGMFWLCGIRGKQPVDGGYTQWISGGAFAVRRSAMYENFNFKLFYLFENKIGMGEDAILGYTLSKHGKVVYAPEELFYHNDQKDSTYTVDFYSYGKRVAYSRLYLSFEYARLTKKSKVVAFMHYNWYMLWRLVGMSINQIINYKGSRSKILKGYISGYLKALIENSKLSEYDSGLYWKEEGKNDVK